jgi:hypothetical protein
MEMEHRHWARSLKPVPVAFVTSWLALLSVGSHCPEGTGGTVGKSV